MDPTILQKTQVVSDGERGLLATRLKAKLLKYRGVDNSGKEEKKMFKNAGITYDFYENKG